MNTDTGTSSPSVSASTWGESADSERALRVLMIDSETTWRGGQNQLALLLRGLSDHRVAARIAAPRDAAILKSGMHALESVPLSIRHGMDFVAAARLARHLHQARYDIIHCHSSHAHSTAFLATWPERLLKGVQASPRRPRIVVSRRVAFPLSRRGPSALKYRSADLYLAISSAVRDVLIASGVSAARVALVPSGVDLDVLRMRRDSDGIRAELGIERDATVVGTVAALTANKSVHDLVRAARDVATHIDNLRVVIVGEGPTRTELERLVARLDLQEHVLLTGFRSDVLDVLSVFDCFVLASRVEGLGTSIMDAQALGVPVVATRTGGTPDLVQDGRTGLLVPPGDPELLGGAIVRMLRDPGLQARCTENARLRAQRYDYRNMVRGTLDAYRTLLDEPRD
jgi:glycosyltransferase involved in cell wall biosynthesis